MRFHTMFFTHIMRFCSTIFPSIYALISTTKKQSKQHKSDDDFTPFRNLFNATIS